jgi:hypothetical protein
MINTGEKESVWSFGGENRNKDNSWHRGMFLSDLKK